MSDEYTPTTTQARDAYLDSVWTNEDNTLDWDQVGEQFDRWIATHDAAVASALRSRLSVAEAIISRAQHCAREEYAREQILAVLSNPLPPLPTEK